MSVRPIIGISAASASIAANLSGTLQVEMVSSDLVSAVRSAGGLPVLLPAIEPDDSVLTLVAGLDGLVLSSGQDVDPATYAHERSVVYDRTAFGSGSRFKRPMSMAPNDMRDRFEIALYREARSKRLPLLGLCRGMHIMNVADDGTLHQELPERFGLDHFIDSDGWINYHELRVSPGSRLASILGVERYVISTLHHQGLDRLGSGWSVSAHSDDMLPEFIESIDKEWFAVGVQGHIEKTLKNLPLWRRVWSAFIEAAHANRAAAPASGAFAQLSEKQ